MSTVRVVFLGTPLFARYHLEQLLNDEHYEIVGVVSQPDRPSGRKLKLTPSPVKELAIARNLQVMTPEKIGPVELKQISLWRAEAAIVVAYGQILSQNFLELFPNRVVNVHASLLPRWRGAAPIQRAIMAGDDVTGVSLQVMVQKLDAGDIIGKYPISIANDMDALELHDAMLPLGAKLLNVDLMDYLRGNISPVPQDETKVTYASKILNTEARINWQLQSHVIHNQVRGLKMGPGAAAVFREKLIKIHKTKVADLSGPPGQVIKVSEHTFTVACGSSAIEILELQPESRPRLKTFDFLLGCKPKLTMGEVFS